MDYVENKRREKSDGCLDRIFAGGVRSISVICGHFLTHSAVLILQTTLMLIVVVFVFQVKSAKKMSLTSRYV
jgi:ABC-type transport system involved in cytochrome c biogenesis permease component